MTQQFFVFVPGDIDLGTRARFLYNVPNRQVWSSYVWLFGSYRADKHTVKLTNWQTNRRRWKHPPRSAMLRRWAKSSSWLLSEGKLRRQRRQYSLRTTPLNSTSIYGRRCKTSRCPHLSSHALLYLAYVENHGL